jgi:hypothetical protein
MSLRGLRFWLPLIMKWIRMEQQVEELEAMVTWDLVNQECL